MSVPEVKKYTCPTCGATISNIKRNIENHNKTSKHLRGFNSANVHTDVSFKASEAQRIREFRANKKAELGEQKYKNEIKEYKQKYRREQKDKKINVNVDVNELESNLADMKNAKELVLEKEKKIKKVIERIQLKATDNKNDVISKMVKASDKTVSAITAKVNLERVGNIYKYIFNKQWGYVDVDFLEDFDKVVASINTKYQNNAPKTRSNQFVSIAALLKFHPQHKELYKKYSKLGVEIVEQLDKKTKNNTLSEKQLKRLNWGEIKKVWYKLGDENGGNSFLRALFAIYVFIPTRRILDYNLMKVIRKDKISETKIQKLDKKYNYLFVNKDRKPLSFTIYNYKSGAKGKWSKTNKNYGQYELNPIPEKLANVLQSYILDEDIKANDYLFGLDSNHQKPYSNNGFSSLVSNNLFETFSGHHITVNDLRSSYTSWYLDDARTMNEKEQMAFELGSSVHELQKTYYKIELTKGI